MQFRHYDLGHQDSGTPIKVTLSGSQANVCLLDDQNFRAYRQKRRFSYYGGLVKQSPYSLQTPHGGRWHVVIDLGGSSGSFRSAVEIG